MIGGFGSRPGGDPARSGRVKVWVRDAFGLPEASTVMVSELTCTEPGCPPIETVVAILEAGATRRFKIHRPLAEVTEADIRALPLEHPHVHPTEAP